MTTHESTDEIPAAEIEEHYSRVLPVFTELGSIDDGEGVYDCLLVPGTNGNGIRAWYQSTSDSELASHGDGAGRPYIARADADTIPEEVQEWDHPTVFSSINYQSIDPDDWTPYEWDDGREWLGEKPLPAYNDIRGLALFADVDFESDAKSRPVDADTRALVEDALGQWVAAYADAVGDPDAVYVLDSVGGTYVMVAPYATWGILGYAHEYLDDEDRERLIDELASRWRSFNASIQEAVAEDIPELTDVFELDGNTNKNRLYKAPLAIHKSLPGVVTPIDTENIQFRFTPFDAVTEELVDETREWAAAFTTLPESDEEGTLEDYASQLVETLFPTLWEEHAQSLGDPDWREVLSDWVQTDRTMRHSAAEQSLDDLDTEVDTDDLDLTDDPELPFKAADQVDVEEVAEKLDIISNTDQADADNATRIEVQWRPSDSGDSAIVRSDNFTDLADGTGGGAAELVAWTELGGSNSKPFDWRQDGEQVSQVLGKLREFGYNIPVYVPARGCTYTHEDETKTHSRTPDWALAKVARLFEIAPEEAIDSETGKIGVNTLHNWVLDVLDHYGMNHNRTRRRVHVDPEGRDVTAAGQDIDLDEFEPEVETATSSPKIPGESASWTDRYGIHEREFIDGPHSPYAVQLPGCEDIMWIEIDRYGQRSAGYAHYRKTDGGKTYFDHIVNADLELVSRLKYPDQDDREEEWELKINPTDPNEPPKTITIDPSAFNSPRDFREEIKGRSASMRFSVPKGHQSVDALKTLVNAQDAPCRKVYSRIKLIHENVAEPRLVTPNGTLGPEGWVDEPEHIWGDMGEGDVIDKWELHPDLDEFDQAAARNAAELLVETRVNERFLPILGYVFASTFRAPITDTPATATDKWAHIQGFGDTGTGKSSIGEELWEFIGMQGELIKARKTQHSALVTLTSTNSIPLLLDEYKPSEWRSRKRDAFHEYLRDCSTGSTTTKTWNYPIQKTYHLDSSVVLFGEGRFPSSANALARRAIETTLSRRATKPDSSRYRAFKELATTQAEDGRKASFHHALAWWGYALGRVDDKLALVEEWQAAREWALAEMERRGYDLAEVLDRDMYRQHIQTVTFGVRVWRHFAESVLDVDPTHLPTDQDIGDAIEYITMRKNDQSAISRSDQDQFFELAASAAEKLDNGKQEYLEVGDHYAFVHEGTDRPTELRFHLRSCVEELNRFVRDYGMDIDVCSKNDYYSWIKEAADDPESYCLDVGVPTNGKRMVSVDLQQLIDELDIREGSFRPRAELYEEDVVRDSSGDDDDDGNQAPEVVPLEDVEAETTATVTVRVESLNSDTVDEISWEADAVDETDRLQLLAWESTAPEVFPDEGGHYRLVGVKVTEYKGSKQLQVQAATNFEPIQQGAAFTEPADSGDCETLDSVMEDGQRAATDGGGSIARDTVPDDAEGKLADARRLVHILTRADEPLEKSTLLDEATSSSEFEMGQQRAETALEFAVQEKRLILETAGGYEPARGSH